MKWLCLAVLFIFLTNDWKWFKPLDGSFEVLLPGIPSYKEQHTATEIGDIKQCKYAIQWTSKNEALQFELVQYTYPHGFNLDSEIAFEHIRSFKDSWKTELGAEELYFQQDENGASGNNVFSFRYDDSLFVKSTSYWKGKNIYHLQLFCLFKHRFNNDITHLESSFRL